MTGVALCFQLLAVGILHMATFATQFPMAATQREFCVLIMIEPCFFPAFRRMAVFALRTVSSLVCIVTAMARDTISLKLLLIQNPTVTTSAGRIAVLSLQWKIGFCMIKTNAFPCFRCMTLFTTVAVATTVDVLCLMARTAILLCFFITLAGVAKFTTDLFVFAAQRKLCLVMIEPRITPLLFFVAITALLTEFSSMIVIVTMAIYATTRRRAVFFCRFMAGGAVNFPVGAAECEIRYCMIESANV